MRITREDANRILRFCLSGTGGYAQATVEEGICTVTIRPPVSVSQELQRFEATTFEEALGGAVAAGLLRARCVEKQIELLLRAQPGMSASDVGSAPLSVVSVAQRITFSEPAQLNVLTSIVAELLHETQRERGCSSLYTSSEGRLFRRELGAQWGRTDMRATAFTEFVAKPQVPWPSAILQHLDNAQVLIAELGNLRRRVESLAAGASDVIEYYTTLNNHLLSAIEPVSTAVEDPAARTLGIAAMTLLHAKEKAGIERAQLANAFTRDRFAAGQYQMVTGLIAAQQSYLHIFSTAAPSAVAALLQEKMSSDEVKTVARLERIALEHRDGGFGVASELWFSNISKKIDLLKDVERVMLARMQRPSLPLR